MSGETWLWLVSSILEIPHDIFSMDLERSCLWFIRWPVPVDNEQFAAVTLPHFLQTCHCLMATLPKHVKAKTKWMLFHRWHFKSIVQHENCSILIKISLKVVLRGPIKDMPALVYMVAWCRTGTGDKPLSEAKMPKFSNAYMWHPTSVCW